MSPPGEGLALRLELYQHFCMGFPRTPHSVQGIQKGQNELLPSDGLFRLVLVCLLVYLFAFKEGEVYILLLILGNPQERLSY